MRSTMLKHPFRNNLAVAHVSLLYIFTRLYSHKLSHETVKQILIVFSLIRLRIIKQSKLNKVRIGKIIECKKVGTCLLECRRMSLECVSFNTRKKLSRAMSQTLMQVGMKVVGDKQIFFHQLPCRFIDHKLIIESVAL